MQTTKFGQFVNRLDPSKWIKNPPSRRAMIISLVMVLIVSCGVWAYDKSMAHSYETSPLPHGTKYTKSLKWAGPVPYQANRILFQPGTAFDINERLKVYGENANSFAVAVTVGLGCAKIPVYGPYVAPFCAAVAGVYWTQIKEAFKNAVAKKRCVQITFAIVYPNPGPIWVVVKPFGAPQQYLWKWLKGPYGSYDVRYWGNPDDCKTRNLPAGIV